MGAARILAAVIALGAVVLQLVPDAVSEVGWWALIAVGLGLLVPLTVEWVGRQAVDGRDHDGRAALELAYVGLLVHQFGDGLALGALGSGVHDHGHEVSLVALGLHAVALSSVFVLAFRQALGLRHALARAAGMALALASGAALAGVVPGSWLHVAHPWVAAATAGLLLHVAMHPLLHHLGRRQATAVS